MACCLKSVCCFCPLQWYWNRFKNSQGLATANASVATPCLGRRLVAAKAKARPRARHIKKGFTKVTKKGLGQQSKKRPVAGGGAGMKVEPPWLQSRRQGVACHGASWLEMPLWRSFFARMRRQMAACCTARAPTKTSSRRPSYARCWPTKCQSWVAGHVGEWAWQGRA